MHAVCNDLGGVFFDAVFIRPFAGTQLAFDVDLRPFFKILAGDFGELAEERNTMPFSGFLLFATRLVFPFIGRSDGDIGHGIATGHVPRFRIASEVAYDNNFIDRCHNFLLLNRDGLLWFATARQALH